jgi:phage major head subunit gpT-like protein
MHAMKSPSNNLSTRRSQFPIGSMSMQLRDLQRDGGEPEAVAAGSGVKPKGARATLVFAAGAPVKRYDWNHGRYYLEELVQTDEAINLDRLNRGAPLLNSHQAWDLGSQIGVVENPRIEGGRGVCDVVFSRRDDVQGIVQDVQDQIIRNVSVGYSRDAIEMIAPSAEAGMWVYRVTRWTPHEVSLVPIPADMDAQIQRSLKTGEKPDSQKLRTFDCALTTRSTFSKDSNMDNETAIAERATQAERTRVASIRKRAVRGVPAALVEAAIAEGLTPEQASERFLDALVTAGGPEIRSQSTVTELGYNYDRVAFERRENISPAVRVEITDGRMLDFVGAATDAVLQRNGITVAQPHPGARDLRNVGLLDIAASMFSMSGRPVRTGLFGTESRADLARRAMASSDFAGLLANVQGKALRIGYENEPRSWRAFTRITSVADFKQTTRAILGSAPDLERVNELGEYHEGSLTDDAATLQVEKFGKIVSLSWEALVNDDAGAFARLPQSLGMAAARLESDRVYALLAANAYAGQTMQDSVALFNAAHNNITASAAALNDTSLSDCRVLLRKQKALGGGYMNLDPAILLLPAELETIGEQLIAKGTIVKTTTTETPNNWMSRLQLAVEARLPGPPAGVGRGFYLVASPAQVDVCELAMLEDQGGGPVIERRDNPNFDVDSISWKIRHVFAVKFTDWRGIVRVPLS